MEPNKDAAHVLETEPKVDSAPTGEQETVEEKLARLEKTNSELDSKNKQLFERLKKQEKPIESTPETRPQLSTRDSIILAKSVDADDIDEVLGYAEYKKLSVTDALKDTTLQAILDKRIQERKTAAATQIKQPQRSAPKDSPDEYIRAASGGNLPDSDEGIDALAEARIEAKRQSRAKK